MPRPASGLAFLLLVVLAAGCGGSAEQKAVDLQTQKMLDSETLSLKWGAAGFLKPLGECALDLQFPGPQCSALFADTFRYTDLTDGAPAVDELEGIGARIRTWTASDTVAEGSVENTRLFAPFFEEVEYLEKAKFKIYLPVPQWLEYPVERRHGMLFAAKAHMRNGKVADVKGLSHVTLRRAPRTPGDDITDGDWRIVDWKTIDLRVWEADEKLFEEVLDEAIDDPLVLERARRSLHEEMVRDYLLDRDGFEPPHESFRPESFDRHPCVSVTDIDRDGLDDFFVGERWGRAMLFRNRGDGRFEEVAGRYGLDLDGDVQAALFADFDNDGDDDVFVARHLHRSLYLVNEGGRFHDRTAELVGGGELPFLGSSISAADYDGDGLLDVYLSTYAGDFAQRALNVLRYGSDSEEWLHALERFLPAAEWNELLAEFRAAANTNRFFTDRPGPRNLLLRNAGGGRFEPDAEGAATAFLRNSYQATWADYDGDGDPDLYVANDFSPNFLFRNDGGEFTDVTAATGTADVGFGMGAAWGDYDGDGRQDLYVSNMFSKAGRRVTSFFMQGQENFDAAAGGAGLSPVYRRMAAGNSLFRNVADGPWPKVSGMPAEERYDRAPTDALPVEEGGWAWGAQFSDFNLDSHLDLFTLSGYYSAPKEAAVAVDL